MKMSKADDMFESDSNEWIFILKLGDALPDGYVKLVEQFAAQGISLVPIEFDQYIEFFKKFNHIDLIVVENGLEQRKQFTHFFKRHFEFAVKNKLLSLYHLSSFAPATINMNFGKTNGYHYYQLPLKVCKLVDSIITTYSTRKYNRQKWPGGRRGRLPQRTV